MGGAAEVPKRKICTVKLDEGSAAVFRKAVKKHYWHATALFNLQPSPRILPGLGSRSTPLVWKAAPLTQYCSAAHPALGSCRAIVGCFL